MAHPTIHHHEPIYHHSQPAGANDFPTPAPTIGQEMLQYHLTTPPPLAVWQQIPTASHSHHSGHPMPPSAQEHFVRYTVPPPSTMSLTSPPPPLPGPMPLISQPQPSFCHAPSAVHYSSTDPSSTPVAESASAQPLVFLKMPPPLSPRPFDQPPPYYMRMPPPVSRPFNPPPQPLVPATSTTYYNLPPPPPPAVLTVPFNAGPPVQASTMPSLPLYNPTGPSQMFLNALPPKSSQHPWESAASPNFSAVSQPQPPPPPMLPTTLHPRTRVKTASKPSKTSRSRRRSPVQKPPLRRPRTVSELMDMSSSSLGNLMTRRSTKRWSPVSLPPPAPPSSPDIIAMDDVSKTQPTVMEPLSTAPETLPSAPEKPLSGTNQSLVLPPPTPSSDESIFENKCIRDPAEDQSRNENDDAATNFKSEIKAVGENKSSASSSQIFDQDDDDQNQSSPLTPRSVHSNLKEENKKIIDYGDSQLNKSFDVLSLSASERTETDDSRSFAIYIGDKLKKYSRKTRNAVQHEICHTVFKADQGVFE